MVCITIETTGILFDLAFHFRNSHFIRVLTTGYNINRGNRITELRFGGTTERVSGLFIAILFRSTGRAELGNNRRQYITEMSPRFAFTAHCLSFLSRAERRLLLYTSSIRIMDRYRVALQLEHWDFLTFSATSSVRPAV